MNTLNELTAISFWARGRTLAFDLITLNKNTLSSY